MSSRRNSLARLALAAGLVFVAVGVTAARADPMTLRCHQDYVYTPTLPPDFKDVDVVSVQSDDPAIVKALRARKGGGTAGQIEVFAQGKTGAAEITYTIEDAYTGQRAVSHFEIAVDCPEPPKTTTGPGGHAVALQPLPQPVLPVHPLPPKQPPPPVKTYPTATHVTTSCKACRGLARELNAEIDAYNAAVTAKAAPAQLDRQLNAIRAMGEELDGCDKLCRPPAADSSTAQSRGSSSVLGDIGVHAPRLAQPNKGAEVYGPGVQSTAP